MGNPVQVTAAILLSAVLSAIPPAVTARQVVQDVQNLQTVQAEQDRRIGAERLLVRGMTRLFLGDTDGAVTLFEQAANMAPDAASVQATLAEALQTAGRTGESLLVARKAAALEPDNARYGLLVTSIMASSGDAAGALAMYDSLRVGHPRDLTVLLARARFLSGLEQRTSALEAYREIGTDWVVPDDVVEEHLSLASTLGFNDEVLRLLDDLIVRHPFLASLQRRRGETLVRLGRAEEATTAFETALELDPSDADAREAVAALYRPSAADSDVPTSAARRIPWASRLISDGTVQSARRVVEIMAPDADAGSLDAIFLVAAGLRRTDRPADAARRLADLVERDPGRASAWRAYLDALRVSGQAVAALVAADEARLFFPGDVPLAVLTGAAALNAFRPAEAESSFLDALALLDEQPEPASTGLGSAWRVVAWSGLVRSMTLAGRPAEAASLRDSLSAPDVLADAVDVLRRTGIEIAQGRSAETSVRVDDVYEPLLRAGLAPDLVSWLAWSALDSGGDNTRHQAVWQAADRLARTRTDDSAAEPEENPAAADPLATGATSSGRVLRSLLAWHAQGPAAALLMLFADDPGGSATPTELVLRGDLLAATGDRPGARTTWEQVLVLLPDNPVIRARLERP